MTDLYHKSQIIPLHWMQAGPVKTAITVNTIPKTKILTVICQKLRNQVYIVQVKLRKRAMPIKVTDNNHSIQICPKQLYLTNPQIYLN